MHILQTQPGGFVDDADGIVRIEQTPADIIILSAADTELAMLSDACHHLSDQGLSLRLANLMHLRQHASVDLYIDDVLQHAKIIVVSLLGGESYWPYGVESLLVLAEQKQQTLILVSGDDNFDSDLARQSRASVDLVDEVWRYLRAGGKANSVSLLQRLQIHLAGQDAAEHELEPPKSLPRIALYHPEHEYCSLEQWREQWQPDWPVAALVFYRAHLQASNTAVFDALLSALKEQRINPLPVAVASLKDPLCRETFEQFCFQSDAKIILNTTAFALSSVNAPQDRPLAPDIPVLQVMLSSTNRQAWQDSSLGMQPRDLAMHVALPEVDGRLITRIVSFKGLAHRCELTETDVVRYEPDLERCGFVSALAARWLRLARRPVAQRRVAIVMANYPTREGRLGNGVGLDTPASVHQIMLAMAAAGYSISEIPDHSDAILQALQDGVTNDPVARALRPMTMGLSLQEYLEYYRQLPQTLCTALEARWGAPESEPSLRQGYIPIAGVMYGETFVGIQPARGYHLDLSATYHDPDLVPPHSYLAYYFYLRHHYDADAVINVGKHGNLEWLPGKGLGLSETCWPDAVFGPMPNIYPFIVNDPGEGAQAKRRTQAVIIDHLIPPLTRAESYGPLAELERLVDEFYQAAQMDPRRADLLREEIIALAKESHLSDEVGADDDDALIGEMDNYLCELKEAQIRDGLHIFGLAPTGRLAIDTTVALLRLPRGDGKAGNASLIRALADDFGFDFDPLNCQPANPWTGEKPAWLQAISSELWRTEGDTRERLELAAALLVEQPNLLKELSLKCSLPVLQSAKQQIQPLLQQSAADEIQNTLNALNGRFVPPGPSGAPSRGRLDVLPTGRNFYSVDVRAIPTVTAWHLGWKSAHTLIERHLQEEGDYPAQIGLSVWGTATMRTGGDDIAQAFALMGVKPVWDGASHRVIDFEVLPVSILDRPRIDVMLRVSGFFRDAFMNVIKLFDAAVKKLVELDESEADNPIKARVMREAKALEASQNVTPSEAQRQASFRVFGSKPGSYGAGLQGLIDEGCWDRRADLAQAYVNWGGYAYGQKEEGESAHSQFERRLSEIDVVVQNQDNREHDILDSDDYYQFQGGMSAAVATYSGAEASVYHMDHSQPEAPRARTLKEEINRVVRSRVLNPKWLAGARRHGYKGAFEMAATVDYLFAYDATAQVVDDYQYQQLTDSYLLDDENRQFMQDHNPSALKETTERLLEAMDRGLWQAPPESYKEQLSNMLLALDQQWEQGL